MTFESEAAVDAATDSTRAPSSTARSSDEQVVDNALGAEHEDSDHVSSFEDEETPAARPVASSGVTAEGVGGVTAKGVGKTGKLLNKKPDFD